MLSLSLSLARTDYIRNGKSNGKGFVDLPCKDCKKKKKKEKQKRIKYRNEIIRARHF